MAEEKEHFQLDKRWLGKESDHQLHHQSGGIYDCVGL